MRETLKTLVDDFKDPKLEPHLAVLLKTRGLIDDAIRLIEPKTGMLEAGPAPQPPEEGKAMPTSLTVTHGVTITDAVEAAVTHLKPLSEEDEERRIRQVDMEISVAYMGREYEKVIALAKNNIGSLPEDSLNAVSWAYIELFKNTYYKAEETTLLDSGALYEHAILFCKKAHENKPNNHIVLNTWGAALAGQARLKSIDEADNLFKQAYEKYEAALIIKPDYNQALHNCGNALFDQAILKSGKEANALFEKAREKYLQAEKIKKGFGAYNLACIESHLGNEDECKRWLEASRETSINLPPLEYIQKDADLDPMRDKQWFKDILDTLKK